MQLPSTLYGRNGGKIFSTARIFFGMYIARPEVVHFQKFMKKFSPVGVLKDCDLHKSGGEEEENVRK